MRLGLYAVIAVSASTVANAGEQETQRRFLTALMLAEQGQLSAAAETLRELYKVTPTPRIQLELARILMLSGELSEARALFVKAYAENPPPDVKSNILFFVQRIDQQRGRLRLNFSVAHYANPLQQPGAFSFNVGGFDLDFEPDETYRNLWGVNVGGSYSKDIGMWNFAVEALARDLPGDRADRFWGEVSVAKRLAKGKVELRTGVSRFAQTGLSFTLPYIQAAASQRLTEKLVVQPTLRVGKFESDVGRGLSGWQYDSFAPVIFSPVPSRTLAIGPTFLRQAVALEEQAFSSYGVRAVANWRAKSFNVEGLLQGRISRFDEVDPFWGKRRVERTANFSVFLNSDKIKVANLLPTVGLTCDLNKSSVEFFNQKGCAGLFEIRRIF